MKKAVMLLAAALIAVSPALATPKKKAPETACVKIDEVATLLGKASEKYTIVHRIEGDELKKFNDSLAKKGNVAPPKDQTGLLVVGAKEDPDHELLIVFVKGCVLGNQFVPTKAFENAYTTAEDGGRV